MSVGWLSYRNGKYQGGVSGGQRQGVGVLVDDDLTFHVSHWQKGRMEGPTLLYLAHAKYIYGEWKNNEPHGFNVYRSGDTVLLAKYLFGVPAGRCLVVLEREGFACVLREEGREWSVVGAGAVETHSQLMRMVQLLGVEVPEHYLSLIKFACSFSSSHHALRTFPCHRNHCYFGYLSGLAIVFDSNNALFTVGHHRNEQLCGFGGKFFSKRAGEQGNFGLQGETVQYKGERPTQKIYSIYQKLHKRDSNFVNETCEGRTKVFASIQCLIVNKLKTIVEASRRSNNAPRFDLNQSLHYRECDDQENQRLGQIRDKIYSPPKRAFERQTLDRTPSKSHLPQPSSLSINRKSISKPLTAHKQQEKILTPSKVEKNRTFVDSSKSDVKESKFSEGKRGIERPESSQLYDRINQLCSASNYQAEPKESMPIDSHLMRDFSENRHTEESNHLQETSTFKRICEEEAIHQANQELVPTDNLPKERSSYKRREKSIEQLSRPKYQDIEERRKRILRDYQELNTATPTKQPPKMLDSPCQSHQISVGVEEQSSFGYIPLSISSRLNQKRETGKLKQEKPQPVLSTHSKLTLPQRVEKASLQESQERRERSSTRRANYNYGQDIALPTENRDPAASSGPLSNLSPARQRPSYQYMFQ